MSDDNPNFWGFLLIVGRWIDGSATRILGGLQGILAIVASQDDFLTHKQIAGILLAIAILTYLRGQQVSTVYTQAKTIVAQNNKAATLPLGPPA